MKKALGILLAAISVILGAVVIHGIKESMERSERDAAERAAANAAADAAEKLAARCSDLRKETRELKRRAAKLEGLVAGLRDTRLSDEAYRHRHDHNVDIGEEGLRRLRTKNPAEFNWRTNVIASWGAARILGMHENVARRLELLDSLGSCSMSTLDAATHENYREMFSLEALLRELLIVKEFKDRTLNTDDDGVNEAHARVGAELREIRGKMHAAYARERELLLTKTLKTMGMSEERQTNAVASILRIITATGEGSLTGNLPSLETVSTNASALAERTLRAALHGSCTNGMAALDAIDTGKMKGDEANLHRRYRQVVAEKDELQERYLETRINALLKKSETESVAKALDKARGPLEDIQRKLGHLERQIADLKRREREMLLAKTAESLELIGADVDYFIATVSDLIAALGTPPM